MRRGVDGLAKGQTFSPLVCKEAPCPVYREPPRAPQLEKTHETPPSSRDVGLLFLHGLETEGDIRR